MLGARDQLLQRRHHLAAVAGAERERIAAREELLELGPDPGVEQDRAGPAAAGAQHVAVGKSAACGEALESRQRGAAGDQVGHVDVHRLEAGAVERRRHLDMAVHALLPKNCDTGANAGRRSDVFLLKSQMHREARILGIDDAVELLPRACRVVAQRLHAPRGLAPGALHVVALVRVELLAVARDENLVARVELADEVRALAEARVAQGLHHARPVRGADLQHRAQLLAEQRGEHQVLGAARKLLVVAALERVDVVRRRVEADRIHVERHAAMPGERHLADGGEQPAVGPVVVREHQRRQLLQRREEALQQRRIV